VLSPTNDRGPCSYLRGVVATTPNPLTLPHHNGGGGLQGGWDKSSPEDDHIAALPYKRWAGPMFPIFIPRQRPLHASCTNHLTLWDPKCISRQTEDTETIPTTFLVHHGVMGTLHLPIPSGMTLPSAMARPPRVPLFRYPIPEHALDGWKSKVAVESYGAIALAKAMSQSLMASLTHSPGGRSTNQARDSHPLNPDILGLAYDIQAILGEALAEATIMFPLKTPTAPSKGTLPRHLWPRTFRQDISNLRRRAKAIRRLIKHEAYPPGGFQGEFPPRPPSDSSITLWASVATPLSLRTAISPPPRNLDTLGVLVRPDSLLAGTSTLPAANECFTGLGKAVRHLIRHACNFRRDTYGKALFRVFVKKKITCSGHGSRVKGTRDV